MRGDELDPLLLAEDAGRFRARFGGFERRDLEAAGVEVVPTFRTPHVTLCHRDLDE